MDWAEIYNISDDYVQNAIVYNVPTRNYYTGLTSYNLSIR